MIDQPRNHRERMDDRLRRLPLVKSEVASTWREAIWCGLMVGAAIVLAALL